MLSLLDSQPCLAFDSFKHLKAMCNFGELSGIPPYLRYLLVNPILPTFPISTHLAMIAMTFTPCLFPS
jgi:hypothetical protein